MVANLLNLKINNFVTVNKYRELHPAPCFTVLQQDVRVAGFHNASILHHKNPEEDHKAKQEWTSNVEPVTAKDGVHPVGDRENGAVGQARLDHLRDHFEQ